MERSGGKVDAAGTTLVLFAVSTGPEPAHSLAEVGQMSQISRARGLEDWVPCAAIWIRGGVRQIWDHKKRDRPYNWTTVDLLPYLPPATCCLLPTLPTPYWRVDVTPQPNPRTNGDYEKRKKSPGKQDSIEKQKKNLVAQWWLIIPENMFII